VADHGALIAAEMGLDDELVEQIRTAGRLHDIGKIGIREHVLSREGPLTNAEYELVKQHVLIGAQILAPLTHLGGIIAMVRSHHERWDGQGYPDGLREEGIPVGARVLGAAEIFDALTTARPYQEKLPMEVAVERMRDLSGSVLDPAVFDALEASVNRRQALVFLDDTQE
jgi:HD-GYP domain-containing protein (c-di-GMP phosphodiesterase class II)